MILRLAEHLEIPLGDRNTLLLMGGYAPRYSTRSLVDETMAPVMAGLRGLLDAHLPNPSMLLDHRWNVLDANAAVYGLLSGCHPKLLEPPVNVIRLVVHPEGFAPRIRNLPVGWPTCTPRSSIEPRPPMIPSCTSSSRSSATASTTTGNPTPTRIRSCPWS